MFSQLSVCPQSASWILVHCSALLQHGQYASYWNAFLLPPANEVWGKVIFSEAFVKNSLHGGGPRGACVVGGRHAWWGGMCGGGHAWPWGEGVHGHGGGFMAGMACMVGAYMSRGACLAEGMRATHTTPPA